VSHSGKKDYFSVPVGLFWLS